MKCEIEPIEKKDFKPIVIKLTLETEREAQELWHRLNLSNENIKEGYNGGGDEYEYDFNDKTSSGLWEDINHAMKSRNILP